MKTGYLLQADFSVSSSGETYWAVPTNELALADEKREKGKVHAETQSIFHRGRCTVGVHLLGSHGHLRSDCTLPRTGLVRGPPITPPSWTRPFEGWLQGHLLSNTSPDCHGSPSWTPPCLSPTHQSDVAQRVVSWEHLEDRGLVCSLLDLWCLKQPRTHAECGKDWISHRLHAGQGYPLLITNSSGRLGTTRGIRLGRHGQRPFATVCHL